MDIELERLKLKSAQTKVRVKRGSEPRFRFRLWLDCRGSMFALVAARRQKVFKRGIDTYAQRVCRRRRDRSYFPLFDFWYFSSVKSTPSSPSLGENYLWALL